LFPDAPYTNGRPKPIYWFAEPSFGESPMPAYSPAEIHTLFRSAFNLGDVGTLTALYESNAILVVDGKHVSGRENIRIAYESILQCRGQMSLETRSVVESPQGLAVLHGGWIIEGGEVVTRGLSTEVVRKQPDGTWLFVIDNPYTPE
jgi:ketosteroid isomerase-like protein